MKCGIASGLKNYVKIMIFSLTFAAAGRIL